MLRAEYAACLPACLPTKIRQADLSLTIGRPVWMLLDVIHELLLSGRKATTRQLYYRLKSHFESQDKVVAVVTGAHGSRRLLEGLRRSLTPDSRERVEIAAIMRCSRISLNIIASSKGSVIGNVAIKVPSAPSSDTVSMAHTARRVINDQEAGVWTDCRSLSGNGRSIPGDITLIEEIESDARFILGSFSPVCGRVAAREPVLTDLERT